MFVAQLANHPVVHFGTFFRAFSARAAGRDHERGREREPERKGEGNRQKERGASAARFIEIIDQLKCGGAGRVHLRVATRTRNTHVHVPRGERKGGREGAREEGRETEPPTRDRPRICKRSFQLTATMARRIGRYARK